MKNWGGWRASTRIFACWTCFARRWRRRRIRGCRRSNASGGIGAARGSKKIRRQGNEDSGDSDETRKRKMRKDNAETHRTLRSAEGPQRIARARRKLALTTPDLVLLSLLAERVMHGYQANLELERREIQDCAGVSRPQVYYSLEKLARAGLIRASETNEPAAGPERSTYETTTKGRVALADALERDEWATQRERPAFLTWIALSWQARPGIFRKQMDRRGAFLAEELLRVSDTLPRLLSQLGPHQRPQPCR